MRSRKQWRGVGGEASFKGSKVKRKHRMSFRKFKADQLFDGYHLHGDDKVLVTDDSGKIEAVVPLTEAGEAIQTFKGILSHGLVICHCYLEICLLINVIPTHTSLVAYFCYIL